ncbi:unnamed protein product [Pleuronectes platessa]|uniref:Uncharacterized protein n=1 Tax=Pleuronectes platessa TaxID=8262 RepID=A0A9N7YLT3_PLEPL|nr:unnamed protein product [Pleuronectes platessa]
MAVKRRLDTTHKSRRVFALKAAPRRFEPAPRSGRGRLFDSNSWEIWSVHFRASAVSVGADTPQDDRSRRESRERFPDPQP